MWLLRHVLLCAFCQVCSLLYLCSFVISWDLMEKNRYFSYCVPRCSLWLLALFFSPVFFPARVSHVSTHSFTLFPPFFWLALQKLTGIANFSSTDMWTRARVCVIVVVQTCHSVICPEYFQGRQLFILAKWWEALKAYSVKKVNYKRTTSVPDLTSSRAFIFLFCPAVTPSLPVNVSKFTLPLLCAVGLHKSPPLHCD